MSVRRKLNAMPAVFEGKNVLLIDDSIVRGTTMSQIVDMVRKAGAKKVRGPQGCDGVGGWGWGKASLFGRARGKVFALGSYNGASFGRYWGSYLVEA